MFLKSEITASHKGEYTDEQVSRMFFALINTLPFICVALYLVAVQRLYEGQRRSFINCKPENAERAQDSEIRKKYRARRERVSKTLVCF